ncbi:aminotransferase class I/II-fold pyridoxal phosphate-dependent enzyme [Ruficoccus amylovorans]|uniref:Aminotransferase class I/II-fold pyridoxal phosphate-dependent enzyme n=1 Tax=Ruficoccus amylovorans TaxID=1804625 RepID=A0A842HEH7_9BACT|nr:aminotransferase class I/II-fold pyridoxal phosphate-dependent enzyme [Ruficoccus amylovorans]MBC2594659.1 aminotransferase class I/II-fold pyridoxal phosphate-dependent enzyme [Ruficoccus amylovorans]
MSAERIYLSPPDMSEADLAALTDAFRSNWIAPVGPALAAFEAEMCRQLGVAHAVALASGTAALHLALKETGVKPGDRVFCSTMSFAASANAVVYCGAEPVFIDSERAGWNMDPALLEKALREAAASGQLPAAVEVVQAYGQCADMDAICALCDRYEVPLIEDAAEALGASYRGRAAGSFGRAGVLSFNGNKIITCSGGGMLVTDDAALAARVRYLSTQAREPGREYIHREVGYNYRLSNLLAALGLSQLNGLPQRVARRREVFNHYVKRLGALPGVTFMPEAEGGTCTRWLSSLLIDPQEAGLTSHELMDALEAENIEARPLWRPLHTQPCFAHCRSYGGEVAEELASRGLSLPSQLTDEQQERVCRCVERAFAQKR